MIKLLLTLIVFIGTALGQVSSGPIGWQVPAPAGGGGGGATIAGTSNQITVTGAGCTGAGTCIISITTNPTIPGHITTEGVTATGATGTGSFVFATSPTLTTPALGTPASGVMTNMTGLAIGGTPLTTQGDLLFTNATPALARLPVGANGTQLQSNGTTVSWGHSYGNPTFGSAVTNLTANSGTVNVLTTPATSCSATVPTSCFYKFCITLVQTRAASSSGTLPTPQVVYTSQTTGGTAFDQFVFGNSNNYVGNVVSGCAPIFAQASTTIGYNTTGYASTGGTTLQYAVEAVWVESWNTAGQ